MSIVIGVGAVILNEQNEVLLILRGKEPEAGKWSIPGGKVDPYETLQQAVIREVEEEVNLRIEPGELICTSELISESDEQHILSLIYSTRTTTGTAINREPDKLLDMKWFPLTNLPPNIAVFSTQALLLSHQQLI